MLSIIFHIVNGKKEFWNLIIKFQTTRWYYKGMIIIKLIFLEQTLTAHVERFIHLQCKQKFLYEKRFIQDSSKPEQIVIS